MGCFFLFAWVLVYVILTPKKAFEKLVVSQYGKLLLTRTCPYQLLLLQKKESLLPKSAHQVQFTAIRLILLQFFFPPCLQPHVPISPPVYSQ